MGSGLFYFSRASPTSGDAFHFCSIESNGIRSVRLFSSCLLLLGFFSCRALGPCGGAGSSSGRWPAVSVCPLPWFWRVACLSSAWARAFLLNRGRKAWWGRHRSRSTPMQGAGKRPFCVSCSQWDGCGMLPASLFMPP